MPGGASDRPHGPPGTDPPAHAGVGDLVQDRLAHLLLVVQAHEVTAECEPASRMVRLAGSTTRPVQGQLPVADVGLLHEGSCQGQDVGKIHDPTVCAADRTPSMAATETTGDADRLQPPAWSTGCSGKS